MEKALEFRDLTLSYNGRQVLSNINIEVLKSEIVGICGSTDSGINYIKNIALRMHDFSYEISGTAIVNEIEIERLSDEDMRYVRMLSIGILNPIDCISGFLTGYGYVTGQFGESVNKPKREVLLNAKRILELLGFSNPDKLLKKNLKHLKGREKRAVIYAAAMAADPALIISYGPDFDMPNGEVDELYKLIIKICKIKNMGMIVLNSDLEFSKKYCEKIYFLKNGKLSDLPNESIQKAQYSSEVNCVLDNVLLSKGDKYGISKNLHKGEIFGVYTGNKKSALVLLGNKKPFLNNIVLDGQPLHKMKSREVFLQDSKTQNIFLPGMKISNIIEGFAKLGGAEQKTRRKLIIDKALELLKINNDVLDVTADELDSFTKYKLGLACAVAGGFRIIVISEPEKIWQVLDRYYLFESLIRICKSENMSVMIVSNSVTLLSKVCNSIFDSHTGTLTEDNNLIAQETKAVELDITTENEDTKDEIEQEFEEENNEEDTL